jgi:hypothetical protein
MRRLWITIVNNETAEQAMKRGRNGALMYAILFTSLAVDAWWFYKGEGAPVAAFFAALYMFAAWRIHRGSAELMDLAMILLPLGAAAVWRVPAMELGGYWYGIAPFLFVLFGFELLNGVRGASYLHAPLGLKRRNDGDAPSEIHSGPGPNSPLRPRDSRMPEST